MSDDHDWEYSVSNSDMIVEYFIKGGLYIMKVSFNPEHSFSCYLIKYIQEFK